ncbi:MAG: DUF3313 family protein [Gammaproteobacteria bacterium]
MLNLKAIGFLLAAVVLSGCATSSTPDVSYDGLTLVPDARFGDAVYRLPGADLSGYEALGLVDCEVAFRKNWLRDQNRASIDLTRRVTQQDVDRIRDALAEECDTAFRSALLEAPAYTLTESFDAGEAVLILRPSIVNLDVSAPDVATSARTRTYTTSTGEMTLVLEAIDGTTGQILARVIDRQRGRESFGMDLSSSILARWAEQLRKAVDAVVRS